MNIITANMLLLKGDLLISDVLGFELECRKNSHIMVKIEGTIPEEIENTYFAKA